MEEQPCKIYTFHLSCINNYVFIFRLLYVRNGDFETGGPIESITQIMYIPLDDDELAEEINRRFNDNPNFAQVGLSLSSNTQTTTSPSVTPTNMSTTTTPINTNCSATEETFITSTTGFAAIAGVAVACLALITCAIIACVYLRVKQRTHNRKVKRFVCCNNAHTIQYTRCCS